LLNLLRTWERGKLTSSASRTPPISNLSEILKFVEGLDAEAEVGIRQESGVAHLAHFLAFIEKHLHEHSTDNRPICTPPSPPTPTVTSIAHSQIHPYLSVALFGVPAECEASLKDVIESSELNDDTWKEFAREMKEKWATAMGYSWMLLASNLAFLAIPFLIATNSPSKGIVASEFAMLLSLISTVLCIGSLTSGFALVAEYNKKAKEVTCVIRKYFERKQGARSRIAVKYSFPGALLYWSFLWFIASLLVLCWNTRSKAQLLLTAPAVVAVIASLVWTWLA